jgi:hypothetical protein
MENRRVAAADQFGQLRLEGSAAHLVRVLLHFAELHSIGDFLFH